MHFELGDYNAATASGDAVLELLEERPDHVASRQKIALRKAKSCLYLERFDEASAAITAALDCKERTELQRCIRMHQDGASRILDPKALHEKLILELPRYKPSLCVSLLLRCRQADIATVEMPMNTIVWAMMLQIHSLTRVSRKLEETKSPCSLLVSSA